MPPYNPDFLRSLGTEVVDIYVGKQKEHRRLHKKVFEQRLPGFLERYLKDDTTTEVNLPDLNREPYGFLVQWLFIGDAVFGQGFHKDAHSAAEVLCELYGFAENLGANDLMDDSMTALYAAHYNDPQNLPFHYTNSYEYTKPGSKLRDFQARRFVWELVNLQKQRQEFIEREPFLLDTILRGFTMPSNGFELHKRIAEQTPELMTDLWPILSELSLNLSPPYHLGVCKFHMHSEEEECSAASQFKEPRSRPGSRAGSVDSYAGGRSTNGSSTRYGSSERGSPAPSARFRSLERSSKRGSSSDSVYDADSRRANCRTFRADSDENGFRLIRERSSSCGMPTDVLDIGHCEPTTRDRSLNPRSPSPAGSLPGSRAGSVASSNGTDCRSFLPVFDDNNFRLVREHSSSCGKPADVLDFDRCERTARGRSSSSRSRSAGSPSRSRAESPIDTRPFSVQLAEKDYAGPLV